MKKSSIRCIPITVALYLVSCAEAQVPDGYFPQGGVTGDAAGNLYGTTSGGGAADLGTVFKISPDGVETVLYSFRGSTDGEYPASAVVLDGAGNVYGTTVGGNGTVFRLSPTGVETVLHRFTGGVNGSEPIGGVILDGAGNLLGTAEFGGAFGFGNVYKLTPDGAFTVLYSFTGGADGANPWSGVTLDAAGNLYGTTSLGGTFNYGTVYSISVSGIETVLYSFQGGMDGSEPLGTTAFDAAGNIYGTTYNGGATGLGTVFQLSPSGQHTVLHSFGRNGDGAFPKSNVVLDPARNLYGTTSSDTAFRLMPAGSYNVFHFGGEGGETPLGKVILGGGNYLYGTTEIGGANGGGVVFRISPKGVETVLHSFANPVSEARMPSMEPTR